MTRKRVRCPLCGHRLMMAEPGWLAPGKSVELKCSGCRNLVVIGERAETAASVH